MLKGGSAISLAALILALAALPSARAFNSTSTDFFLRGDVQSIGGRTTSTDFIIFNNGAVDALNLATSTDFQLIPGLIRALFQSPAPTYTLIHYHFRFDNGTEQTASSATNGIEDVALTNWAQSTSTRLRVEISNTGGTIINYTSQQFRIEYGLLSSSCASSSYSAVTSTGAWTMFNSGNLNDASDTTNIAVSTGGVLDTNHTFLTPNGGVRDSSNQTGALSLPLPSDSFAELEYDIQAVASSTPGATYCFRVTNAGSATSFAYSQYPQITLVGGAQSISLVISTTTVNLPGLAPGTPITGTSTATVTLTGGTHGYSLQIQRNSSTSTLSSSTTPFPDYASWNPSSTNCTSGEGNATTTPGKTFALRVQQTGTTANYCSFWWGASDASGTALYAGVPTSTVTIVNATSTNNGTSTSTILYRADVPSTQKATNYTGLVTITVLANP